SSKPPMKASARKRSGCCGMLSRVKLRRRGIGQGRSSEFEFTFLRAKSKHATLVQYGERERPEEHNLVVALGSGPLPRLRSLTLTAIKLRSDGPMSDKL